MNNQPCEAKYSEIPQAKVNR